MKEPHSRPPVKTFALRLPLAWWGWRLVKGRKWYAPVELVSPRGVAVRLGDMPPLMYVTASPN